MLRGSSRGPRYTSVLISEEQERWKKRRWKVVKQERDGDMDMMMDMYKLFV